MLTNLFIHNYYGKMWVIEMMTPPSPITLPIGNISIQSKSADLNIFRMSDQVTQFIHTHTQRKRCVKGLLCLHPPPLFSLYPIFVLKKILHPFTRKLGLSKKYHELNFTYYNNIWNNIKHKNPNKYGEKAAKEKNLNSECQIW